MNVVACKSVANVNATPVNVDDKDAALIGLLMIIFVEELYVVLILTKISLLDVVKLGFLLKFIITVFVVVETVFEENTLEIPIVALLKSKSYPESLIPPKTIMLLLSLYI